MNTLWLILFGLNFSQIAFELALCETEVVVKLTRFYNPEDHDFRGNCCDLLCAGACDPIFSVCLDHINGIKRRIDSSNCPFFWKKTKTYKNDLTVNFGSQLGTRNGNFINPFRITKEGPWQGMLLKVYVEDYDKVGDNDPIDWIHSKFNVTPVRDEDSAVWVSAILKGDRSSDKTSLSIQIKVFCSVFYYGSDCNTYCRPQDNDQYGHYVCSSTGNKICRTGWEDDSSYHSQNKYCSHPADDCQHNKCGVNGTCIDGLLEYTCHCDEGFYGKHCQHQYNQCLNSPCQSNAQCIDDLGHYNDTIHQGDTGKHNYVCLCQPGFSGHLCQLPLCDNGTCADNDLCDYNTCHNNGTCVDGVGCDCPKGLTGVFCEVMVCSTIDCGQHSFGCQEGICVCKRGYKGRLCNVNECDVMKCDKNQICQQGECHNSTSNEILSSKSAATMSKQNKTKHSLTVAVCVTMLVVVAAACLLGFLVYKKRKGTKASTAGIDDANRHLDNIIYYNEVEETQPSNVSNPTYDSNAAGAVAPAIRHHNSNKKECQTNTEVGDKNPKISAPEWRPPISTPKMERSICGATSFREENLRKQNNENDYASIDDMRIQPRKNYIGNNDYAVPPPAVPVCLEAEEHIYSEIKSNDKETDA